MDGIFPWSRDTLLEFWIPPYWHHDVSLSSSFFLHVSSSSAVSVCTDECEIRPRLHRAMVRRTAARRVVCPRLTVFSR